MAHLPEDAVSQKAVQGALNSRVRFARMPANSAESANGVRLRASSICWSERALYRAQQKRDMVGSRHVSAQVHETTVVIVRLLRHPEGRRTITLNSRPVRPALLGGSDYLFEYAHEGSAPRNCASPGTAGPFGSRVGMLVLPLRVIRRPYILRRQRFIGGELFISPER